MSYHTYYSLEFPNLSNNAQNDVLFDSIYHSVWNFIGFELSLDGNECAKWYDHDDHMIKVSKMYPTVLMRLHGEGDENGDLWNTYYLNGKMQHCPAEIIYPEFDETKLT